MNIKKLDSRFDTALWIIFLLMCVGSWNLAKSFEAPTYEIVDYEREFPYSFTSKYGDELESKYKVIWYHEDFSSPKIKLYDPLFKKMADVKDEFLPELQAEMPKSKYSAFYYHWFWVFFGIFVVISAIFVYSVGGIIRDNILYNKIKKNPDFKDCCYFLYTDRQSKKDEVQYLLPQTIGKYIDRKIPFLSSRYSQPVVSLLTKMLEVIKNNRSTEISYSLSYDEKFKPQKELYKYLYDSYKSRIGYEKDAPEVCSKIEEWMKHGYINIESKVERSDLADIVTLQLNDLFKQVMGEEIFKFRNTVVDNTCFHPSLAKEHELHVDIKARNGITWFNWNGTQCSGRIPAINITFTISNFVNGKENILWKKDLEPVSTYQTDQFNAKDLYDNMIKETVRSFTKSIVS